MKWKEDTTPALQWGKRGYTEWKTAKEGHEYRANVYYKDAYWRLRVEYRDALDGAVHSATSPTPYQTKQHAVNTCERLFKDLELFHCYVGEPLHNVKLKVQELKADWAETGKTTNVPDNKLPARAS